jgi:UDP-N-acetyl-D-glucosamine dehydrogenase
MLQQRGASVDFHDPYIPVVPPTRDHPEFSGLRSVELNADNVSAYDAVLISTDHDGVDYQLIVDNASLVIDTRNALKNIEHSGSAAIIKA